MALANNVPVNTRAIKDANYITSVALPNAANTVNTNALDLLVDVPFPTTNRCLAQVVVNAGNGANNKNVNVVFQHCGALANGAIDSANYANIPGLGAPALVVADANGAGLPVTTREVVLPPGCKRFIRAQATGEANGGNAANANLTLQLLF